MKDWPYKSHPTGWYQIGYADELAIGEVRPLKYFGEDLVLFRNASGEPAVLDAFCRHLGSHLGHGGKIVDDCIQCPWHGWRWSTIGENTHIPYADSTRRVQVQAWPTREIDGLLLTWYDALGREPWWEWPGLPEFEDTDAYYPIHPYGSHSFGPRAIKPQSPLENTPDYQHFPFVHGSGSAAEPVMWSEDGHYLHAQSRLRFGEGHESTWITPNGPAWGDIDTEAWGLGLGLARMTIEGRRIAQLIAVTPIDDVMSEMFSTSATTREPGDTGDVPTGIAKKFLSDQLVQIQHDFAIWENQRFVEHPTYVGQEERQYARFRRWTTQFYPELPDDPDRPTTAVDADVTKGYELVSEPARAPARST